MIWLFCRKTFYAKIEMIQQKTLKIALNRDVFYDTFFTEVSLHEKILRLLVKELYKCQ